MKTGTQIPIFLALLASATYAAGPNFAAILGGSGQDYATSVTSDAQGNVYVAGLTYSPDFPVTTGAVQTKFGGTRDAFVAKLAPDGKVLWCTYLGGILDDWATGVAVDRAGNVLVTGYTRSANFPLVNALQSSLDNGVGDFYDAFVAKLDPNGAKLLYSTFLGGADDDGAAGIAADAAGDAYVAVSVNSATGYPGLQNAPKQYGIAVSKLDPLGALVYSFFHPYGTAASIAVDAAGSAYVAGTAYPYNPSGATKIFGASGAAEALVFKISPDGTKKIYETTLGGGARADGTAIAVDSMGQVFVAGTTSSVDFPVVHPLQSSPGGRPLWKSTDTGTTWSPMDDLTFALPQRLVVDPASPNTLYAATGDLGVFKSLDGGSTWGTASSGIAESNVQLLRIDPLHPQILYAATSPSAALLGSGASSSAVYKTVDGANSWRMIDSQPSPISDFAVDAQNPNVLWEVGSSLLRKSTDAGTTWNTVTFPGTVQFMALDPRVSGTVFAISNEVFCGSFCTGNQDPHYYRSVDGGANWVQGTLRRYNPSGFTVDGTTNPSTLYDGFDSSSVDGGLTWSAAVPPPGADSTGVVVAIDSKGTIYAAIYANGNFISQDHAQTWTAIGSFIPPWTSGSVGPAVISLVPSGSSGALYAITGQVATSGFVTKLSADGSSIVYSTYLRGHPSMGAFRSLAGESSAVQTQNGISGIALDAAGNATVAGATRAVDFPVALAAQPVNAGLGDAFLTTISADGSKLNESTYFGGSQDEGALAVAVDSQGNAILVGQTFSYDFPVPGGIQPPNGYGEAFVVKLSPPGSPAIASVLNGASFQPGIEAGSWVMIQGVNLANTYPARIWRSNEIVNGNLPTSLDGVSVTIDGKPAFVYYISSSQINVQAPSDTAVGAVDVVVNNNGSASPPATAQLQAAAPAFFMYPGTNYAVASRLPDYALVADPSVVPGTVAAKPGDIVVLWGTGFGPTNPAVAAGSPVTGAPAVLTTPTVTAGGTAARMISAVLTPGSVGLYQVTVQLSASMPTGAVAVQASVGGAQTQTGALLFVGKP